MRTNYTSRPHCCEKPTQGYGREFVKRDQAWRVSFRCTRCRKGFTRYYTESGELHPNQSQREGGLIGKKVSDETVKEMRDLYFRWKREGSIKGYQTLASIFGCGVSTARDIVTFRTRGA